MACLLQNTFTVYDCLLEVHDRPLCDWTFGPGHAPHVVDARRVKTFCDKCVELSDAMAEHGSSSNSLAASIEMERVRALDAPVEDLARPAWMPVTAVCDHAEFRAAVDAAAVASSSTPPAAVNSADVPVDDITDDILDVFAASSPAAEPAAAPALSPAPVVGRKRRANLFLAAPQQQGLAYEGYGRQRR